MTNPELTSGMNEQLNREVTTALRYMLQAAAIQGAQWEPVRSMYLAEVTDEISHAQYLANQLVLLGATPKLTPDLTQPPSDVRAMLKADVQQERMDVANYAKLAALAVREGQYSLKLKLEEQAADEGEHAQKMTRFLG